MTHMTQYKLHHSTSYTKMDLLLEQTDIHSRQVFNLSHAGCGKINDSSYSTILLISQKGHGCSLLKKLAVLTDCSDLRSMHS